MHQFSSRPGKLLRILEKKKKSGFMVGSWRSHFDMANWSDFILTCGVSDYDSDALRYFTSRNRVTYTARIALIESCMIDNPTTRPFV